MGTANYYAINDEVFALDSWIDEHYGLDEAVLKNVITDKLEDVGLTCAPPYGSFSTYGITPRSFETGILGMMVYNDNKHKDTVAYISFASGYYEGMNLNVYTGDELEDIMGDHPDEVSHNQSDASKVLRVIREVTRPLGVVAQFSNGEAIYQAV